MNGVQLQKILDEAPCFEGLLLLFDDSLNHFKQTFENGMEFHFEHEEKDEFQVQCAVFLIEALKLDCKIIFMDRKRFEENKCWTFKDGKVVEKETKKGKVVFQYFDLFEHPQGFTRGFSEHYYNHDNELTSHWENLFDEGNKCHFMMEKSLTNPESFTYSVMIRNLMPRRRSFRIYRNKQGQISSLVKHHNQRKTKIKLKYNEHGVIIQTQISDKGVE